MLHAIVLAGGSGTRFWPASRRLQPKQLLAIGPSASESLIAATVRRIEPLCGLEHIHIATGEHLLGATRQALPALPAANFYGEPLARNTAPCIAWVTALIARRDPDALVMVLPSDQHVTDEDAYRRALETALRAAQSGEVATIGVTPTRPETGYGYIELGEQLDEEVYVARRFVEKPHRQLAEQYLSQGGFVWNAGMFFFRATVMLEALERHLPELSRPLERLAAAVGSEAEPELTQQLFASAPSVSIDYGVLEKLEALRVVPASFGWSDLGSWESAWQLSELDADGNAGPSGTVFVDAHRNLVQDLRAAPDRRVIALVGVDDLVVVETEDALLVMPRDRAQDVRAVVEELKARRRDELL